MIEIRQGIYKISENDTTLIVKLSKEFFEKEPIMEAIHEYSNSFNVNMQPLTDGFVGVSFSPKKNIEFDNNLVYEFSNKVIDYQIRRDLNKENGRIRDIIVEYAYSPIKKKLK